MVRSVLLLLFSIVTTVTTVEAQRGDDLTARLAKCRSEGVDVRRLACFDEAVRQLGTSEVVVVDRARLERERRQRFGLPGRDDGALAAATGGKVPQVSQFSSTVRKVVPARDYGRWDMELADGSVWQSIDTGTFGPKQGAAVTIRRASLGGYRASVAGRPSILVKRLR